MTYGNIFIALKNWAIVQTLVFSFFILANQYLCYKTGELEFTWFSHNLGIFQELLEFIQNTSYYLLKILLQELLFSSSVF